MSPLMTSRTQALPPYVLLPLLTLLTLLVALSAGCDDREEVAEEDRRVFFSANRSGICPDTSVDPADQTTNAVELIVTVFGDDGQVVEDAQVEITSPQGVNFSGTTNDRGQFRPTLLLNYDGVTPVRPPDEYEFTATIPNGDSDDQSVLVGSGPFIALDVRDASVTTEEIVVIDIFVQAPCDVSGLRFDLSYLGEDANGDPLDVLDLLGDPVDPEDPLPVEEGFFLEDANADGTNEADTNLSVIDDPVNDVLSIEYRRVDDEFGSSRSGAWLTIRFVPNQTGEVDFEFLQAFLEFSFSLGGDDRELTAEDRVATEGVTVEEPDP